MSVADGSCTKRPDASTTHQYFMAPPRQMQQLHSRELLSDFFGRLKCFWSLQRTEHFHCNTMPHKASWGLKFRIIQLGTNLAKLRGGAGKDRFSGSCNTATNGASELPRALAVHQTRVGRSVRAMVQSSAVPSEPGAPIGAHWSGGGRGQQGGGLPLGTGQGRHLYGHCLWPLGKHVTGQGRHV